MPPALTALAAILTDSKLDSEHPFTARGRQGSARLASALFLLTQIDGMRMVWFVSVGVLLAAGVIVRGLRRHHRSAEISQEAVSGEWLAHERGREEQQW